MTCENKYGLESLPTACLRRLLAFAGAVSVSKFVQTHKLASFLDEETLWERVVTQGDAGRTLNSNDNGDWKSLAILNANWSDGRFEHRAGPFGFRDVGAVLLVPGFLIVSARKMSYWGLFVFPRSSDTREILEAVCEVESRDMKAIKHLLCEDVTAAWSGGRRPLRLARCHSNSSLC